ncbi:MAG TPA: ABC transporter substrate-binding protein, partial [Gammaproteobacteria bacterium]|nr:ABC transporter substrate-binding protein [Gammaproteobacteria bacterium]
LEVDVVVPEESHEENASGALRELFAGSADIAVLPRPIFLIAASRARPVLAFANLLRNDPINLIVHRDVVEARGLAASLPLAERLHAIRGLRIGVAPGPPPRLRALLATAGLEADRDVAMVVVPGEEQNEAFAQRRVDALYAHTPFLERALVEQDGVMIVNQSAGEVAELADRQIHMLVTTRDYALRNPDVLTRVTRAIYRAQQLIHADRVATVMAIRRSGARLEAPGALETLVDIYASAIPTTPEVSAEGALRELALFPGRRRTPDLGNVDIAAFVDNGFAERAVAGGTARPGP